MARKLTTLALCAGVLALPAEALADNPGTDGGPAWSRGAAEDSSFGHCHGRKSRSGAVVHWAVNN